MATEMTRGRSHVVGLVCPKTGKRSYTRKEALRQVHHWSRRFVRMKHYRCHACGGWHIGNALQTKRKRWRRMTSTVKCPICGEPYKVYDMYAGDQSACPSCRRKASENR